MQQQCDTALDRAASFADRDTAGSSFDISFPLPESLQCARGMLLI